MTTQYCILLVDRSGSMAGKEQDTVGGINSCIQELKNQKQNDDNIFITLILFDHEEVILWDNCNIDSVSDLEISHFKPRGQTALLDTMGNSIKKYVNLKNNNSNIFDSCIIYVATDGYENCSRNYNREQIKNLIHDAKTNCDIVVVYMAANQDAILEANKIGINENNAINYDENTDSTHAVYRSAARVAHRARSGEDCSFLFAERQASQPSQGVNSPPVVTRQNIHVPVVPVVPEIWKQHIFLDASKQLKWDVVCGLLNESPGLINVTGGDANRWTALHQAAASNNKEVVNYLLQKGADKNIKNRDNKLPLELCTSREIYEILTN
tara:strand:+ start:289 stop:1263 length:975 start_codon:yes stop_codon:yes gene_type:complete